MIGNYVNGVLTIREGITHLEKNSISGIDGLRKIIFPSTLTSNEEETICNQDDLEILDFSRVTKLEEIPEYMVCYGGESIRRFVIPQGVKIVNDSFLCSASLEELYVPSSVEFLGFPLDTGEELEANIYVYGSHTDFRFYSVVDTNIYVLSKDLLHYQSLFEDLDCADDITVKEMPADKVNFYL